MCNLVHTCILNWRRCLGGCKPSHSFYTRLTIQKEFAILCKVLLCDPPSNSRCQEVKKMSTQIFRSTHLQCQNGSEMHRKSNEMGPGGSKQRPFKSCFLHTQLFSDSYFMALTGSNGIGPRDRTY